MSLPNPGMDFTPFDILTAQEMDDIIENIEALADGSGLDDGAVTPAKLLAGTGTSWPWQTWAPTWTSLSVGNGTLTSKYTQIGKTVFYRLDLLFGNSTSVSGAIKFTLPVTAAAFPNSYSPIGQANIVNDGGGGYNAFVTPESTTQAKVRYWNSNNNQVDTSATAPATFATNYILTLRGSYEAA